MTFADIEVSNFSETLNIASPLYLAAIYTRIEQKHNHN